MSTEPAWTQDGALFDYDFFNQRSWPQTFSSEMVDARASDQCVPNAAGVWTKAASGVLPRSSSYLEIEPGRTNSIRNNSIQGAVVGTPGTLPTNWVIPVGGIVTAASVIEVGVENGMDYIEVSVTANASGTFYLRTEDATTVVASNGQTWTVSNYFKWVSGSNATLVSFVGERTATGMNLAFSQSSGMLPGTTSYTRDSITRVNTNASTAFELPAVGIVFAAAGTVQFRIGWPQLELGATATSPIQTTSSAVARAPSAIKLQRTGVGLIVFTFDDDSQQTISSIPTDARYTLPTNLNRALIKRMTGYNS